MFTGESRDVGELFEGELLQSIDRNIIVLPLPIQAY